MWLELYWSLKKQKHSSCSQGDQSLPIRMSLGELSLPFSLPYSLQINLLPVWLGYFILPINTLNNWILEREWLQREYLYFSFHWGKEKQNRQSQFQLSHLFKMQRGNNRTLSVPVIEHKMGNLTIGWAEWSYIWVQRNRKPLDVKAEFLTSRGGKS